MKFMYMYFQFLGIVLTLAFMFFPILVCMIVESYDPMFLTLLSSPIGVILIIMIMDKV